MIRKLKKYKPTAFMAKTSQYSQPAADYAVSFIEALAHTKGSWAGKPFELIDWQEQIIRDVFGILKPNGYRQFNTAYVEIPKKMGKQVALDTPIPTPDGFSTMGAIAVGDIVFDERGKSCRVVAKSVADYTERAYRITFKDGEVIEAGENHQWFGEYTRGKNKPCILTTGELANLPRDGSCFRFRIPLAGALETPDADLPVEPYLYGYWLGNGNAVKPEITVKTGDVAAVMGHILPFHAVISAWQNTGDSNVVRKVSPPTVPVITAPKASSQTYAATPRFLITTGARLGSAMQKVCVKIGTADWEDSVANPERFSAAGTLANGAPTIYTPVALAPGSYTVAFRSVDSGSEAVSPEVVRSFTVLASPFEEIIANVTKVKAAHIRSLRAAVNNVRDFYGLSAVGWSEDVIASKTSISWAMNGSIGSIVLTVATSPIATKRIVSAMNDNILAYCSAMAQARRMLSLRLITKEEYGKIDTMMLHKYGLSLGSLFRDMTLIMG